MQLTSLYFYYYKNRERRIPAVTLPFLATFFEPTKEKKTHTDTSEFTRLLGIVGWSVFGLNSSWLVATV